MSSLFSAGLPARRMPTGDSGAGAPSMPACASVARTASRSPFRVLTRRSSGAGASQAWANVSVKAWPCCATSASNSQSGRLARTRGASAVRSMIAQRSSHSASCGVRNGAMASRPAVCSRPSSTRRRRAGPEPLSANCPNSTLRRRTAKAASAMMPRSRWPRLVVFAEILADDHVGRCGKMKQPGQYLVEMLEMANVHTGAGARRSLGTLPLRSTTRRTLRMPVAGLTCRRAPTARRTLTTRPAHTASRISAPSTSLRRFRRHAHHAALHLQPPFDEPAHGARIDDVLLLQQARRQRIRRIAGAHLDGGLQHDRAVVQFGGHEMDRCAVHLDAHGQCLLVRMQPGKAGQQRRMDIEQASCVALHEARRQDAHETRQHHQIRREAVDGRGQGGVEAVAVGEGLVVDHGGGDAVRSRKPEAGGVRAVGDHGGDAPRPALGLACADDGFHIRAASGNENDDIFHRSILSSAPRSPGKTM